MSAYFGIRNELADTLLKGSHQLAGVPERDRGVVLRVALDVVPEAAELLRPFPALFADGESSASRLAFSCLSAAATFPYAPPDQLADLGALTAILFGVDDIADGVAGEWSDDDFAAFLAALRAALSGSRVRGPAALSGSRVRGPEGPMGEALGAWQAWCARFRRHPGAAAHTPNLDRRLEQAGAAMARERAWASGAAPWPGYDEYLANGLVTILYPTWWAAALAIRGSGHWAALEPAVRLGAACVRLANDIRTFERERVEGKPNSISILERTGLTAAQAVVRVSAHLDELEAAFGDALADLPSELSDMVDGQRRSVSFNGRWYLARDTHAYTAAELAGDVDAHTRRELAGDVDAYVGRELAGDVDAHTVRELAGDVDAHGG